MEPQLFDIFDFSWVESASRGGRVNYNTQLTPGVFVLAIVLSIAVAWLTVGYKAVKAALVNPVKSLKAE